MNGFARFSAPMLSCATMIGALAGAALATTPSFTLLGELPGGTYRSRGHGASADGLVAVGRSWVEPNAASYEAFRWTASLGIISLGDLPNGAVQATGLDASADGSVIVGSSVSASGEEAFVWTEAGGMVGLGDLPDTSFASRATAVNGDGTIVVGSHLPDAFSADRSEAFVWSAETGMFELDDSVFIASSEAFDISRQGLVIVGYTVDLNFHKRGAKWTVEDGWVYLGGIPHPFYEYSSEAHATNTDGSIIVGQGESGPNAQEAFMWTQATGTVALGDLPGGIHKSDATGVSFDGSIVVGTGRPSHGIYAVATIWTPYTGMVPMTSTLKNIVGIHVLGTIIDSPSISDDGRTIVASTTDWEPDDHGVYDSAMACRIVLPGPGVCCVGGACVDNLDPIVCSSFCGVFVSDEQTCASIACESFGACIFRCTSSAAAPCPNTSPDVFNQCVVLAAADCAATGGLFVGGDCNCRESILKCPTDVNGDGSTNAGDFNILASNFGQGAPDCRTPWQGDLTCDGVVNISDFNILAGDFGCGN